MDFVKDSSESWLLSEQATAQNFAENSEQAKFLNGLADLYIAGPMTGWPDSNIPAFLAAQQYLVALGFTVYNPAWNKLPPGEHWIGYMRLGINQLVRCRGIYLLKGWETSRGARIELNLACDLKMGVHFEGDFDPRA